MVAVFEDLLAGIFKLLMLAGGLYYAGLVLTNYRAESGNRRPELDLRDPARAAERLLVWLGVRTVAVILQALRPVFDMLAEASAEVGEIFISRRSAKVQAAVRSRFHG